MIEESQESKINVRGLLASLVVLTLLVAVFFIAPKFETKIEFKQEFTDEIGGLVVVISFVSLAVRSAVENFVGAFRRVREEDLKRKIDEIEEKFENLDYEGSLDDLVKIFEEIGAHFQAYKGEKDSVKNINTRDSEDDKKTLENRFIDSQEKFEKNIKEFNNLYEEQSKKNNELQEYKAGTEVISDLATIVAGLLVSIVGVRTLGAFCEFDSLSGLQLRFFHAVDIVLTAGLVLGGSDAIEKLNDFIQLATSKTSSQSGSKSK